MTDLTTTRHRAQLAAKLAAYGSETVRTPADWTWGEIYAAMRQEKAQAKQRKGKQDVEISDGSDGPIFSEGSDE